MYWNADLSNSVLTLLMKISTFLQCVFAYIDIYLGSSFENWLRITSLVFDKNQAPHFSKNWNLSRVDKCNSNSKYA